jgi:3-oxoacyl-[acyl-carrier protein] reductase
MGVDYLKEEKVRQMADALALGRVGEPHDIAHIVAFLASDEASWITGQIFTVNGGGPLA